MNELAFSSFDGPDGAAEDGVNCVPAGGLLITTVGVVMKISPSLAAAVQARTLSLPVESKMLFDWGNSAPRATVAAGSAPAHKNEER